MSEEFQDSLRRIKKREEEYRLFHPKSYTDRAFDEIADRCLRRPENDYGKNYSQDFLRRYGLRDE